MSIYQYRRYDVGLKEYRTEVRTDKDRHADVLLFLEELEALQRSYGLALDHEDGQGAFIVRRGFDDCQVQDASEYGKET